MHGLVGSIIDRAPAIHHKVSGLKQHE